MITICIKKNENVTLPEKGSAVAAGYDIVTTSDPKIVGKELNGAWSSIDYIEYETNLFIAPEDINYHILIHPRSSISKYNLVLANSIGLIDNDYRGMVICRFKYIFQPTDFQFAVDAANNMSICQYRGATVDFNKIYKKGDKIAQLVVENTTLVNWKFVDDLSSTQRGEGGFGSTDASGVLKSTPTDASGVLKSTPTDASGVLTANPSDNIIKIKSSQKIGETVIPPTNSSQEGIIKKYIDAGGVQTKRRYSDEIRERNKE